MTANGVGNGPTYRWVIGGLVTALVLAIMFSAQLGWAQVQDNTAAIQQFDNRQIVIETKVDLLLSRDTN
jgi:hypothetical protein